MQKNEVSYWNNYFAKQYELFNDASIKIFTHSSQEASFQRFVCRPGRYQPTYDTACLHWCRNQTYISILLLPLLPDEPGNDCPLHRNKQEGLKARDIF